MTRLAAMLAAVAVLISCTPSAVVRWTPAPEVEEPAAPVSAPGLFPDPSTDGSIIVEC